jgi:hypothetical protein
MTTNHPKMEAGPTPETSYFSSISQTMGNVQNSVSIINQLLSQIFRESQVRTCICQIKFQNGEASVLYHDA